MTNRSGPPTRNIRARTAPRKLQILVFCEGEKTERQYLNRWRQEYREFVEIEFDDDQGEPKGHTPFEMVRRAANRKRRDQKQAKRGQGPAFDLYCCVFDRDEHLKIPEALRTAADNDILVVFSNPCVELWFLLHYGPRTAEIHRRAAQHLWRQQSGCEKNLTPGVLDELLLPRNYETAKANAQALAKRHAGNGVAIPENNPSSSMWQLLDRVLAAQAERSE